MTLDEYITENKIDILFDNYDNDKMLVQIYKNGKDMFIAFGMCEFISYMDWFYNIKVEFNEKDNRSGYVISALEHEKKEKLKMAIKMFMYEYKL